MHSILESDGVSSDPYEILCHMGTLIVEGRTPKGAGDSTASGDTSSKSAKPYNEGPHCPNFMKVYNKDTHNVHKCTENILCIRHSNLKLHLQSLQQKSASICIEVSLGPDCLCGELRSQSTLVSGQPCKRDVILEQWTITIGQKQIQESSCQMSVTNLYQAVRSLLHFSQLTAWYMSYNGLKPAHVIYRVGVPEDSTFISDDNFVSHDFPVADVNKTVWMKISVKTLPRMEKIPSVYCPQHPIEAAHGSQELKDKYPEPLHSKFTGEKEELMEESLPLKFQGVRKKTSDSQERKRKKHITLYNTPSPLGIENCSGVEFLDGIPIDVKQISPKGQEEEDYFPGKRMYQGELFKYQGESSKAECKKSKPFPSELSDLVKPQPDFESFETYSCNFFEQKVVDQVVGLKSYSDTKGKSDFRTKGKGMECGEKSDTKTVMDILDDRMQISCAISGKHHCKWECEDENDLNNPGSNVEKPKRRRSLSKARINEDDLRSDSEKIFHGKFKEVDCCKSDVCLPLREQDAVAAGCSRPESPPKTSTSGIGKPQTLKIDCLPIKDSLDHLEGSEVTPGESSLQEPSQANWESLESFKRGCALTRDSATDWSSDSESELSDGLPETSNNPFLAAILRTTKKSKKKCDSGVKKSSGALFLEKLKEPMKPCAGEAIGLNNKMTVERCSDLKKSPRNRKESLEEGPTGEGSSELLSKGPVRLKSLFDFQDLKQEERASAYEDVIDDSSSNNSNSAKTIPVPSAHDKLKFRRSLDSAAQLVFHRCSGLPLTSSPAPVRRNNSSFAFDSSLNSVSAIKSALFEPSNSLSSEDENESEGSLKSPASPGAWTVGSKQINYNSLSPLPLLGSFEESVLNGRLEPVSTVQGFTAELGASGSFCPRHLHLPVTVFFYTLGDNDKVSAPYLGHINLGKKGYSVPRSGTIQVTLFNPLRTVVKMFVVVYNLHDMPSNSHTFLRQRTLYVPASQKESTLTDKKETPFEQEDYHKYLRYLIHLRFVSGKTGRIYLHTDIRMVIFRKADEDTATALDDGETYELRSHTHGPINPKFSPRK